MKRQWVEWEKILAYYTTEGGLLSRISKELQKLNNLVKKREKEVSRH